MSSNKNSNDNVLLSCSLYTFMEYLTALGLDYSIKSEYQDKILCEALNIYCSTIELCICMKIHVSHRVLDDIKQILPTFYQHLHDTYSIEVHTTSSSNISITTQTDIHRFKQIYKSVLSMLNPIYRKNR